MNTGQAYNICIVIPVFNEDAEVLKKVMEDLLIYGHTLIVVDDGSVVPADQNLAGLPLHFIRHEVNLGQGAALQTGLNYAQKLQADIAITFDADGQHNGQDIQALIIPIINKEADVTLGSRFLSGTNRTMPVSRKLILQLARFTNFLFTGNMLSDAHNGLRAFNSKAINMIYLQENRMAHASEILFEIKKHALVYKEVPVQIHYTAYTINKGQSAWDSIKVLFDIVLHKVFK